MLKKTLALAVLCGASFAASAVTVDLRHEFIDGGKTDKSNADRVSVSHRFANGVGFSVEAKWKSGGDNTDKPYADFIGNGHEESISWHRPGGCLQLVVGQHRFHRSFRDHVVRHLATP